MGSPLYFDILKMKGFGVIPFRIQPNRHSNLGFALARKKEILETEFWTEVLDDDIE
jgi:hypothetical protein